MHRLWVGRYTTFGLLCCVLRCLQVGFSAQRPTNAAVRAQWRTLRTQKKEPYARTKCRENGDATGVMQRVMQQARAEAAPPPQQHVAPLRVDNTTTWRYCVERTPRNDRWRCALDADGRARGRVLAEGLPPVFGLHDTATADESSDSWIVVMDNERVTPQDIVELCDPAVSGACLRFRVTAQYRAIRRTRCEDRWRALLRLACNRSGFN